MKVLVTGANGYIGFRLLQKLILDGHYVYALVRNKNRFTPPENCEKSMSILQADILDPLTHKDLPIRL